MGLFILVFPASAFEQIVEINGKSVQVVFPKGYCRADTRHPTDRDILNGLENQFGKHDAIAFKCKDQDNARATQSLSKITPINAIIFRSLKDEFRMTSPPQREIGFENNEDVLVSMRQKLVDAIGAGFSVTHVSKITNGRMSYSFTAHSEIAMISFSSTCGVMLGGLYCFNSSTLAPPSVSDEQVSQFREETHSSANRAFQLTLGEN